MAAKAVIGAVGDVMCGESFYEYQYGPRSHMAALRGDYLDSPVVNSLRGCDAVIANVECPISNRGYSAGLLRSHHMRADPSVGQLLRDWGISIANLANNHILEHGLTAAIDTASLLQSSGIAVVGAGHDSQFLPGFQSVITRIGGMKIGFCGACLLTEKYAFSGGVSSTDLPAHVAALSQNVDAVVVSLHWGIEFSSRPHPTQRAMAQRLVDVGATLIVGHHPHVLQGVERIGRSLVAYSLGNFIFDQPLEETRRSMILRATIEPGACSGWIFEPITLAEDHSPVAAIDRNAHMEVSSIEGFNSDEAVAREQEFRRSLRDRLRKHWSSWPLSYRMQVLGRPIIRRLGWW